MNVTCDYYAGRNGEFICIVLKELVEEIAAGISSIDFQRDLKTLRNKVSTARTLYELQKKDFINEMNQSVDKMYIEANIEEKYNEITKLINTTQLEADEKAWRPIPGECVIQMLSYEKEILLKKKNNLENLIQEQRNLKFFIKKELEEKRDSLKLLLEQIKTVNSRKA